MERRSFLKGILALGVAPAIITTSGLLMPVRRLTDASFSLPMTWEEFSLDCCEPQVVGFGLAESKAEGSIITYGAHPSALWPGIKEAWSVHYNEKATLCSFDPETGLSPPRS